MDYAIVREGTCEALIVAVRAMLAQGWALQGSVAVWQGGVMQAMTRLEDKGHGAIAAAISDKESHLNG